MPVFASDMLSSVAYAPDEILLALSLTTLVSITAAPWIGAAVGAVILVIVACYRLNVRAYPSGGGDYEVASKNLGPRAGLIVAAALLVDYVLTLAVSMTVFAAYITTAFPLLAPYRVPVAIVGILVISLAGLRGSRATPVLLAIPTYLFLGAVFLTMIVGLVQVGLGETPQAETANYTIVHDAVTDQATLGLATVLIVLRAFSSGSVALAGVQTVATAVPAFKKPRGKNAGNTLVLSGFLAAVMLTGLTYLASVTGVKYVDDPHLYLVRPDGSPVSAEYEQEPVLGQLAHTIFADTPLMFFLVVLVAALVLIVAANTAVEGFPGLASRLARDGFLPRQLATKGDRLTFSNGILLLAVAAIVLVVATNASATTLIQLYLVGVFASFVVGQLGMVLHWNKRLRLVIDPKARMRMRFNRAVNTVGCVIAAGVLIVVIVSKFLAGAWIAVAAMAGLFLVMGAIHRHYSRVASELAPEANVDSRTIPSNTHAIVVVNEINKPTLRALSYARVARSTQLEAVTVAVDEEAAEKLQKRWNEMELPVPLTVLASPYRELVRPLIAHVLAIRRRSPRDLVIVYIPQYIVGRWWEHLLHNQIAIKLRTRLLLVPNVVVVSVPWRLRSYSRAHSGDGPDSEAPLYGQVPKP
ncbi:MULTISPECIES: APC family permease [unclassified Brevibacterium]|uniref:APC family permease n=1 Tax=unclassified Brevibacterium TaxID=2614124 RepID=UPI0010FA1B9E|nr:MULTISPECIES: APC family permease [unclassified Brevibacterium]MCM1012647.1 APC family permease [Brevibacterium sp. XM4083]